MDEELLSFREDLPLFVSLNWHSMKTLLSIYIYSNRQMLLSVFIRETSQWKEVNARNHNFLRYWEYVTVKPQTRHSYQPLWGSQNNTEEKEVGKHGLRDKKLGIDITQPMKRDQTTATVCHGLQKIMPVNWIWMGKESLQPSLLPVTLWDTDWLWGRHTDAVFSCIPFDKFTMFQWIAAKPLPHRQPCVNSMNKKQKHNVGKGLGGRTGNKSETEIRESESPESRYYICVNCLQIKFDKRKESNSIKIYIIWK